MDVESSRCLQILELSKTLLDVYIDYLNAEEIIIIKNFINDDKLFSNAFIQYFFLPILERVWEGELNSGKYKVISWNKYAGEKRTGPITFATISTVDNIISLSKTTYGDEYLISYDSLFAAINKDGATLFDPKDRIGEYTVAVTDRHAINSYSLATKFITPYQLVNNYDKYNELILDTSKIKKVGDFELK